MFLRIKLQLNKKIIIFIFLTLIIIVGLNYDDALSFNIIKQRYGNLQLFIDERFLFYYILFFCLHYSYGTCASNLIVKNFTCRSTFWIITWCDLNLFASTIGSTLCFLLSRYLFKDLIQEKYKKYLSKVNQGIKEEGLLYLFFFKAKSNFSPFLLST